MIVLSLRFELICYRFVYKKCQLENTHSYYYTFNISSTVSAIITTPIPYHFHINNSFTTDDTPESNQFNFLFHPMSPYYNISYTCFSSPFISSLPLLQYTHQSIQSLPFYHSINVLYLPSILYSFSSLSLLSYNQLLLCKPLPIICILHHFSFFLPSLHSIFLYPPSNLPFCNHYIFFNHIDHPLLYAPLPYHTYVSLTFSTAPAPHHHNSRITPAPLLPCTLASMILPLS